MKLKLFILSVFVLFASAISAQSFLKPLPLPGQNEKMALKMGTTAAITKNSFRPLIGISATILSDGTQLAGGVGAGYTHSVWDDASQKWTTQYSISGLVFLDTKANVVGGILFGFAGGLMQIGPGYNFGTKQFALMTGVGINPF